MIILKRNLAVNDPLPSYYSEVEDIINGILFLASDKAKTITGTELVIDNGSLAI
ncbi:MAG TPA: SDR family oxidoreductase [Ligilactobacillus acidipiscis]|uniref:SDR family oxidoreductase n=1 Tax=Ligilactobacillus acidipiscis TaxID=89059 RepID=A0A921K1B7_9LACO|nr:SDR family oxidoreductase [Ligilactobacillus acidipiscis]